MSRLGRWGWGKRKVGREKVERRERSRGCRDVGEREEGVGASLPSPPCWLLPDSNRSTHLGPVAGAPRPPWCLFFFFFRFGFERGGGRGERERKVRVREKSRVFFSSSSLFDSPLFLLRFPSSSFFLFLFFFLSLHLALAPYGSSLAMAPPSSLNEGGAGAREQQQQQHAEAAGATTAQAATSTADDNTSDAFGQPAAIPAGDGKRVSAADIQVRGFCYGSGVLIGSERGGWREG